MTPPHSTSLDVLLSPDSLPTTCGAFENDDDILQSSTVFSAPSGHPQPVASAPISHLDDVKRICAICDKPLPLPIETQTVEIGTLKPRFLRELQKMYPLRQLTGTQRVCSRDLAVLMQSRIDTLMEQDQSGLARLQDEAMKNLGEYEHNEQHWQRQFDLDFTFGERCADVVARFGGSWKFIGILVSFLAAWLMGQPWSTVAPWDPYPFILLNLFLSMIAALQAPVIMMSQNRQAQLDKLQNDHVATIILRSENQVRHINAKLDHLLSEQWRRLLEIQQTQTDLLQMLQFRNSTTHGQHDDFAALMKTPGQSKPAPHVDTSLFTIPNTTPLMGGTTFLAPPVNMSTLPMPALASDASKEHWSVETQPDDHMRMLLALKFGIPTPASQANQGLIFAHWHTDGDNFLGFVRDIKIELKQSSPVIRRVVYDLTFNDPNATLDDVLAGEGTVELRNEMDEDCMELEGRYLRLEISHRGQTPTVFANGDLPPRYKSTFDSKREDRITDFWKAKLIKINFTYSPPHQIARLILKEGQICENMRVDFFPENNVNHAKVFMRRFNLSELESSDLSYMREVVGPRPLDKSWIPVAHALWPENSVPGSNLFSDPNGPNSGAVAGTGGFGSGDDAIVSGGGEDGEMLMEAGLVTVDFKEKLVGPGAYVFLCDETRVAFRGVIV
ncbi:hypothetical protein HDU98_011717 [Podochytrium sp. JEL0797]|nr:hypothetical protein HDU98_011717 [Podochytrium sp. JEL0797]